MSRWRRQYYEVLPALSVRRGALRQSLRQITVAWMFGVAWISCTSGDQVRAFAKMLGFNDFAFGLLGALPFLATLGQLYASILIERTGWRKFPFILWGTVHRLLWLAVAAVPLLVRPGWGAVAVVLGILAVSHFLGAMATPGWIMWMSDLIPRRIRGRYFARRVLWAQRVQIVVVILLSLALDAATVRSSPETLASQGRLMAVICAIFAVGALLGAVDILLFWRIREMVGQEPPRPSATGTLRATLRELLVEPLSDRVFRNYVCYGATITFTATFGGWYFWRYSTEGLGFSKLGTNCLFMVIGPLAGNLAIRGWGALQDRWGRRPVLVVATIGTCLSVLPWFFTSRSLPNPPGLIRAVNGLWSGVSSCPLLAPDAPASAYLLAALGCVLGGISWGGVGLAQTGVTLQFADGHGRSKYVAASAVLISIGGTLGGLSGGAMVQSLEFLRAHPIVLGPFQWNHWHAAFAVSLVVRLASLGWLAHMPDPGAQPVRYMLRYLTANVSNAVSGRLFYPLRIFGWGRGPAGESDDSGEQSP
ncbi:MAG: MFS transporter [Phycisphaerae bacterium]|nr:MFS transporter [Phycisphaerae bacterium]